MGQRRTKGFIATFAIAAMIVGGASIAEAHTTTFGSSINIKGRFYGRVTSAKPKCIPNRRVLVKKVRPGTDRIIGRTSTNAEGRWSLPRPNATGRFYAVVRPKTLLKNYAHTHRCARARSATVTRS